MGKGIDFWARQRPKRAVQLHLGQQRQIILATAVELHGDIVKEAEAAGVSSRKFSFADDAAPLAVARQQRGDDIAAG